MQPLGIRPEQVLENYSSTPVLHQMLTRQGAACMAQQCPHEQPEETTQEPMTDTAAYRLGLGDSEWVTIHDSE